MHVYEMVINIVFMECSNLWNVVISVGGILFIERMLHDTRRKAEHQ